MSTDHPFLRSLSQILSDGVSGLITQSLVAWREVP
jgi:hypothetical protein